ncbi:MAG: hypothetical protein MUF60_03460 [Vicinamibacterales bacterium]|jgi:uncharacterized membrane protein|nr:hypothetical protein [Vicinamibacterales bacterium]
MPPSSGTSGAATRGGTGGPAAAEPANPSAGTAIGLPPRVAACLAYAAWWLSGAAVLAAEPHHPFVRFHARQALFGFGALWLLGVALWASSFVAAFVSPTVFQALAVLANGVWACGAVAWLACLVSAARGRQWPLPWISWLPGRRGVRP